MTINSKQKKAISWFVMAIITAFLCFYNLGKAPLADWDESRFGSNALEMTEHDTWITPYYRGNPDQWNVKPPLFVNLVRISYGIWGYNELGLRFPSACSAFLSIIILFWFLQKEAGLHLAFFASGMLLGSRGFIGIHTGRSGDADALFTLFILLTSISVYYFRKTQNKQLLIAGAIAAGLGFWTKSTAIFIAAIGLLSFLALSKYNFKQYWPDLAKGLLVFSVFPSAWVIFNQVFGTTFENSAYGGESSVSNSLIQDTFNRFLGFGEFEGARKWDIIPVFLDASFNIWGYVFLATVCGFLVYLIKGKPPLINFFLKQPLLIALSIGMVISYFFILQLSASARGWYFIPSLPFISIIASSGLLWLIKKLKWLKYPLYLLLAFAIGRHSLEVYQTEPKDLSFFQRITDLQDDFNCVLVDQTVSQSDLLYIQWHTNCIEYVSIKDMYRANDSKNLLIVTNTAGFQENSVLAESGNLSLINLTANR